MDPRQRRVSEIMRREVATLGVAERLDLAQDIMQLGRVRHMPVVEGNRVVGIVSSRDLLAASLSKALDFDAQSRRTFLRSVEVGEVMSRELVKVGPDATLAEVADLLVKRQIGCVPVVGPDDVLLGLVTETDLIRSTLLESGDEGGILDVPTKSESRTWVEGEIEELRRVRDELRVRAHLAKADLRDQWERLEGRFDDLERRLKQASRAAEEPLRALEKDARRVLDDLREGYRRFKAAL